MPEIDLKPGDYREKGRKRIVRASRGLLLVATLLAIWAGLNLVYFNEWFPDTARIWAYVVGLGPFVAFWIWLAVTD